MKSPWRRRISRQAICRIAAAAVDVDRQLAKTGPIERFGDLQQGMQQRIAAKGQGAGKCRCSSDLP